MTQFGIQITQVSYITRNTVNILLFTTINNNGPVLTF